jgi:hypothetical protein
VLAYASFFLVMVFLELRNLSEVFVLHTFLQAKEPFGSTRKLERSSRQRNLSEVLASSNVPPGKRNLSEVFVPHTFLQANGPCLGRPWFLRPKEAFRSSRHLSEVFVPHTFLQALVDQGT